MKGKRIENEKNVRRKTIHGEMQWMAKVDESCWHENFSFFLSHSPRTIALSYFLHGQFAKLRKCSHFGHSKKKNYAK